MSREASTALGDLTRRNILAYLAMSYGGMAPRHGRIAEAVGRCPATVHYQMVALRRRGLVEWDPATQGTMVRLTDKGRAVAARLREAPDPALGVEDDAVESSAANRAKRHRRKSGGAA